MIENRSMGGRSLKRFDNDGRLDDILTEMYPGDYVFIQFGINDGAVNKPERYISVPDYKEMLKTKYIGEIEKRGGIPVLLTATPAAWWDEENGCFMESRQDYAVPTREVAEETGAVLLDVNKEVTDSWNDVGVSKNMVLDCYFVCEPLESKAYPTGTNDTTHLKEKGAKEIARATAYLVEEKISDLAEFVRATPEFTDIEGHWLENTIILKADADLVEGVDKTHFMPDKEVTRAEFLKMLMNLCDVYSVDFVGHAYREGECVDVTINDWYCNEIQGALDKGLIPVEMLGDNVKKELITKVLAEATEDKEAVTTEVYTYLGEGLKFDGNKQITREEAAILAMEFISYVVKDNPNAEYALYSNDKKFDFSDEDEINPEYLERIKAAHRYAIMLGMGDGTFRPKETLTRAQAVKVAAVVAEHLTILD